MRTSMNKTVFLALALWLGGAAAASAEPRPAFSTLWPGYQMLLARWLSQDCGVGVEAPKLAAAMATAGPVLEEALWEAFDLGPTTEQREELQASLGRAWLLRHRWLEEHGAKAIGPEQTWQLFSETEEEFRIEEDVRQVARWQDAAVTGLGLVCTERSLARLLGIAEDWRHPSAGAARIALEASAFCSSGSR